MKTIILFTILLILLGFTIYYGIEVFFEIADVAINPICPETIYHGN